MLEEFSDSIIALNWDNVYAKPISFKKKEEIMKIDRGKVVNDNREIIEDSVADIEMIEEGEGDNEDGSEDEDEDDDDDNYNDENNEREIIDDSDNENLDIKCEISDVVLIEDSIGSILNQNEILVPPLNSSTQIEDSATLHMTNS
jgi:hypothetical protein